MAVHATGKNHILVKKENTMLIKRMLYRKAPISRAEIAERLNLTPPTISNITSELILEGVVKELDEDFNEGVVRKVGRQPVQIDLEANARYALGISLGRDLTTCVLLNLRGEQIRAFVSPVINGTYEELLEEIKKTAEKVKGEFPDEWQKLIGIGIAVPALVEAHQGVILNIEENRVDWKGKPLAEDLQSFYGVPVRVENNVRARSYALSLFYPEEVKDEETYALCFVSWGIACPMIFENQTIRGEDGNAGEIGHMIMNVDAEEIGKTTLESYSSLHAVLRDCQKALQEGKAPVLAKLRGEDELRVEMILEAQREQDEDVNRIIEKAMKVLGIALANLVDFMDPVRIFLSGPLFTNAINAEWVETAMREYSFSQSAKTTVLEVIDFGMYGGSTGAAAACIDKYFVRA